jgi:hypothetical protein
VPRDTKLALRNFRESPKGEVRRILKPRSSVNRGQERGPRLLETPALCSHMKEAAFWGAFPTSLLLVTWRAATNVGVVPEPTIREFS